MRLRVLANLSWRKKPQGRWRFTQERMFWRLERRDARGGNWKIVDEMTETGDPDEVLAWMREAVKGKS